MYRDRQRYLAYLGRFIRAFAGRDCAILPMTIPAVVPMMEIWGSVVPIAVIGGSKVKGDAGAAAIPGVTVPVCRIGGGWRVPRVGPVSGVAPIWGGSRSSGLGQCGCGQCGCGNSRHRQRTCDRQNNSYSSHDTLLLLAARRIANITDRCFERCLLVQLRGQLSLHESDVQLRWPTRQNLFLGPYRRPCRGRSFRAVSCGHADDRE